MNALIRNQKNIFKCGYNYSGHPNNYMTLHKRSFITRRHKLPTCNRSSALARYSFRLNQSASKYENGLNAAALYNDSFNENHRTSVPLIANDFQRRNFHLSRYLLDQPSSKIETTVQAIKNKQKEKDEELKNELKHPVCKIPLAPQVVIKKSLKTRIWEEVVHYYHGFRLLFIDIKISTKLIGLVLSGKKLTRRENRLLVRTTSDLFRLIPFSIFIIIPFMELLLPVFIKLFPGMLPSTFQTLKDREAKLKQSLQVKLEMAKFLQKTLDEMSVQYKEGQSNEAKQFSDFFHKIKDPNRYTSNEEIIKFSKRFEEEITLDSLSREQLIALCRVLDLNTLGTTNFLRFHLRMKLRWLAADDIVISREGVDALDLYELQQACKTRGMRAYGLSAMKLREQLEEWIALSLNVKVPPILILLSRAMHISDDTSTTEKLKETIRSLPDVLGEQTKAAIDEREGTLDNKTKIEVLREEERKIKEEREELRQEEKEKKQIKDAEILLDKAPVIESTTAEFVATAIGSQTTKFKQPEDKGISSEDVELLGAALETLSKEKKQLLVEKETIKELKEEIQDYKEDVEELREITTSDVKERVKVSRASKILFKKVNSMINNLDKVLTDLEQKGKKIQETKQLTEQVDIEEKPEELVRIDELVNAIKQMRKTSDESRLKTIESVLSKIDDDKDGHIKVDDMLKVIEAIGRDNVKLNEKQVAELIDLLDKEEIMETEQRIEKAIAKSIKEAKINEETAEQIQLLTIEEELRDTAKVLLDKSEDMNVADKKNILQSEIDPTAKVDALETATEKQKETILPKTPEDISSVIPPPSTKTSKVTPKDKMV